MSTEIYACYNKNETARLNSSSGGVYILIAEYVLKQDGIVYAACYNDILEVTHKRMGKVEELGPSKGAKYAESSLRNTFRSVLGDLKSGNKVLFVGTPCQCEGLRSFIGDSEQLICIDFICHGIPSRLVLKSYLKSSKKNGFPIADVSMRDKQSGWKHYSWKLVDGEGNEKRIRWEKVNYMQGFIKNYFLRPSCYECHFKGIERGTDFTLGDLWGVEYFLPELDDDKGTSLLMVHSDAARKIFDDIRKSLIYKICVSDNIIKYNASVVEMVVMPEKRNVFFTRIIAGDDFNRVMNDLTHVPFKNRIKRKFKKIWGEGNS